LASSPEWLQQKASEVTEKLVKLLCRKQEHGQHHILIRDDYKECAINTLLLLNATSQNNTTAKKPGALHSARWMSQVLYCQKMYMWSEQMSYDDALIDNLHRINLFIALFYVPAIALFYVPAWLTSSIGSDTAINDFLFLEDITRYEEVDRGSCLQKNYKT